jgi:hypothetical protein
MCTHSKVIASACQEATHCAVAQGQMLLLRCDVAMRCCEPRDLGGTLYCKVWNGSELQGGEIWPRLDQSSWAAVRMRALGFAPFLSARSASLAWCTIPGPNRFKGLGSTCTLFSDCCCGSWWSRNFGRRAPVVSCTAQTPARFAGNHLEQCIFCCISCSARIRSSASPSFCGIAARWAQRTPRSCNHRRIYAITWHTEFLRFSPFALWRRCIVMCSSAADYPQGFPTTSTTNESAIGAGRG